jgi:hypothetical protein
MATLGKTTKLQAVNQILSFMGEAPVNSLEDSTGVGDVSLAERVLDEITREVLSGGWHFNTNFDVEHVPDSSKEIILAETILRIDTDIGRYGTMDITQRGNKLYNRKGNTFEFDDPIKTTEVIELPWDDIPETARRYITLRAARVNQDRSLGAPDLQKIGIQEELIALASLREFDARSADYSVFDAYLPAMTVSDYRRTTSY